MKYAVFGVGRQGAAVVFDLFDKCEAARIVGFDTTEAAGRRMRDLLGPQADRFDFHTLSVTDPAHESPIRELIADSACVISALPYALNPALTRLCVKARLPLADLGGNPDVIVEQGRLCDGSTLVSPDCGLAPGLNNMMAVHLRRQFGVTSARSLCGGIPAKRDPANPLDYKLLFSPWGLISEYSGRCAVLRGGRVEFVEALTGREELPNDREAFYTSNNSPLSYESMRDAGLRDYEYKTVRWRGHLERILILKALGFLRGNRKQDEALADGLAQQPWLQFDRSRDVDEVFLRIEGRTESGQAHSVAIVVHGTPRFSAMELTTSWGVTIPAYWIARGAAQAKAAIPTGCLPPERFVDGAWALRELERRTKVERE